MTSWFSDIEARVSDVEDTIYGEAVRIVPMGASAGYYGAPAQDDGRDEKDVTAIVDFNPVALTVTDEGQFDGFQPTMTADKVHVSFKATAFTSDERPRIGDVILLVGRSPQIELKIVRDPEDDGIGRFICVCVPR